MQAANKQFDVGFLGTGYIADWHVKALRSVRNARLVAVCDQNEERVQTFAARNGITQFYTSLNEMLSSCRLDVIHVLLPPELHAQTAGEIAEAGIHVLLEKPMATCFQDCSHLLEKACSKGVRIGVSHNFLFSPVYEQLKADLKSGKLGRPDDLTITWNKGLDQLQAGPFNLWMLREPENIMLEVGPHSVAHILDLVGPVEITHVHASNPIDLPSGVRFYRRWQVVAGSAQSGVTANFSFASGFSEHSIHIRGSLASASVDFERNTYILHQHTKFGLDFDSYRTTVSQAKKLQSQARRTFYDVVLSKLKRSIGGSYGQSITRSIRSFYGSLTSSIDTRLSPEFGREVVRTCVEIGQKADLQASRMVPGTSVITSTPNSMTPETTVQPTILVLGATGFIGQELIRQFIAQGTSVRVLVRNPGRLPRELQCGKVQVAVGDLSREADICSALDGMRVVYHLARPHVTRWEEYLKHEVEATRRLAKACLSAKVERLIYTGTIDSYYAGAKAGTITEDTPLDPHITWRNYYAQSKALSEQVLMSLAHEQGLAVIIFRPGIVIGRGASPLHWGVGMWSWNAVCQVWGKGRNPLPLVLVEDVARALIAALDRSGIEGKSFNLVADSRLSALDYLHALEECTGSKFQKFLTPPWKFYAADVLKWVVKRAIRHPDHRWPSYRDWESRTQRAHYDCSKARQLLNWSPTDTQAEIVHRGIRTPAQEFLN